MFSHFEPGTRKLPKGFQVKQGFMPLPVEIVLDKAAGSRVPPEGATEVRYQLDAASSAAAVLGLGRPIAGLLNNAGMVQRTPAKNAPGWDMAFAANYLGPFA